MNALIPKVYPLLLDAVEVGARYGYHRAYKHTDCPTEDQFIQAIIDAVTNEILERFDIPEKFVDTDL